MNGVCIYAHSNKEEKAGGMVWTTSAANYRLCPPLPIRYLHRM